MLVLRHRGGGDKRDGEKNAKRQVICALIPVSYVRMKGQKKVDGMWRGSRREDRGRTTQECKDGKKKLKGRKR